MKIGVLDHGLLVDQQTHHQTYQNTIELAKFADDINLDSFWVSEQHGVHSLIISYPLLLMNELAHQTKNIKIGCGGIMLSNYQPYSIIEQINTLNILQPKRFIYGFGSNPGTDNVKSVFESGRHSLNYYSKLLKITEYYNHDSIQDIKPYNNQKNEFYLLITGVESAIFAAKNNLAIIYGWFLLPNKTIAKQVIETYIEEYQRIHNKKPVNIGIALNVVSCKNKTLNDELASQIALFRLGKNDYNEYEHFPTYENVKQREFDDQEEKKQFERNKRNIFLLNSISDVEKINKLCEELHIDNLIISPLAEKQEDKKRALTFIKNYFNKE
ncbi:MsnO8 family LLM class oxidoreductase [Mycoplasma phocoenae]|uniref:MsnO8 family LLM class oxidoreductase n=1 Tax=Mycoplasma phocoenae TaxID=754517 RepID=A0A858U712_9MOLU|nr:MsnO8 family LLM class oxidoreductase [Mycoplasma phocoenae]QJG67055.1 MsnO8 family LLM class oxidoreductase [Mycoplasma phocoenae]